MKILHFSLYLWVIFAILDPDLATQINADPDPQPWGEGGGDLNAVTHLANGQIHGLVLELLCLSVQLGRV